MWQEITIHTRHPNEFLDITVRVGEIVTNSGVKNGVCLLFVPHTTAGITLNENTDPDVVTDLLRLLDRMAPRQGNYRHAEGNSDAHLKASLLGFSCSVPIIEGRLALGTWQGIYLCEFDGPRLRRIKIGVQA